MRGIKGDIATVDESEAGDIAGIEQRIGPYAAGVDRRAGFQRQLRQPDRRRQRDGIGAGKIGLEDIGDSDAARGRGDVGGDVDGRRDELDLRARREGKRRLDGDRTVGRDTQSAEARSGDWGRVEIRRVGDIGRKRGAGRERAGDGGALGPENNLGGVGIEQPGGVVASERQRARERRGVLTEFVAIGDAGRPGTGLARAGDDIGDDIALEHRGRGRQDQAAGVAADDVAVLIARTGRALAERIAPGLGQARIDLAVDHVGAREAAGQPGKRHVGRGVVDAVDEAVGATQVGRKDVAAGIADRTAGDVEGRALLRHHLRRRQRDRAAERGPLADGVGRSVEIAGDLEQAARGVVAVGGIAAGAGRHQDQAAHVDPDGLVGQHAAVAIHRRVAQFVALDVNRDLVRRHRQRYALHARDVDGRSGLGKHPLAGADRDLAALRHRLRAVPEIDGAAGDDLDAGLILAVGQFA